MCFGIKDGHPRRTNKAFVVSSGKIFTYPLLIAVNIIFTSYVTSNKTKKTFNERILWEEIT